MGKKKTKVEPWAPAQPYILKGMEQTNATYDANQPRLQDMSTEAYDAFKSISPGAFQASPFVQNAQASAGAIGSGALLGANQGQGTYERLQQPGNDPSMGLLQSMASGNQAGAGDARLGDLAQGGNSAVAGGQYLNAQPSASLYNDTIGGKYLDQQNPYLESMIDKSRQNALTGANRLFSARGMGTGLSTPFAKVAAGATADAENALRYQNYEAERGRQMQAAGLSDQAWSGERGRMDSMFNAGQDRSLAAAQALNQSGQAGRAQQLAAAQALGGQYNQGQDRSLDAARASDAAQQSQIQQLLTALGLTGDLRGAEFAGIGPALGLLNTAADIPYVGTAALNGQIRQASNGYNTTTQSGGLGGMLLGAGAQLGSAYLGGLGK